MIDLDRDLIPPPELVTDGSSSLAVYISVGAHFMRLLKEHIPLRPDMHVLEMGSSIGRISRQFCPFLSDKGSFTGIDIMPSQVAWCNEHIGSRFPWFRFLAADLYNAEYNPDGKGKASSYRFPFEDNSLDLVVLTSVFTHMLRQDIAHYLSEIQRVLKPEGWCFSTFFMYGQDELGRIGSKDANPVFRFPIFQRNGQILAVCADNNCIEEAIAYKEQFVLEIFSGAGLEICKQLPGNWLKREKPCFSYQDVIVARK